jgi:hypothetical protein
VIPRHDVTATAEADAAVGRAAPNASLRDDGKQRTQNERSVERASVQFDCHSHNRGVVRME